MSTSSKHNRYAWPKAVAFAVFFRWLVAENYVIPSSSMEHTLLTGDVVLVSKLHYGARTPQTPLQVPFTHQHIWGTQLPAYLKWVQLRMRRLPGFSKVQQGDIIVFNHPQELDRPADLRTYYIKRCVSLPGDTLRIDGGAVFNNEQPLTPPKTVQYRYFLATSKALSSKFFQDNGISEFAPSANGYLVYATPTHVQHLKKTGWVQQFHCLTTPPHVPRPHIYGSSYWNEDHFGPLKVPYKGMKIVINEKNLQRYGKLVQAHEGHTHVRQTAKELWIQGKQIRTYTFQQDYYFVLGDNRHNSNDSRFIGFIPANHVVGKATRILLSLSPNGSFRKKIRWNRIGKACR